MTDPDLAERQLEVLRTTYPRWDIDHVIDAHGERWTAKLRRTPTAAMAASGIEQNIDRPDVESLGSALARQVTLLHNQQAP